MNYQQAFDFLLKQIPQAREIKFPGELGLERTKRLLTELGNPETSYQVVHIAGTSGKGSVTKLTAAMLQSQGLKVGDFTSPHLVHLRDRIVINGQSISEDDFAKVTSKVALAHKNISATEFGAPTYSETLLAIALEYYKQQEVQVAVIETYLGGSLDATNAIANQDKLAVLTDIGLDHMHILGNTIGEIAAQKAGIIREGGEVLALGQSAEAEAVFNRIAIERKAKIKFLTAEHIKNIKIEANSAYLQLDFSFAGYELEALQLNIPAEFQARNLAISIAAALKILTRLNIQLNENSLRKSLQEIVIQGRFEISNYLGQKIIIDGAHNPQKMAAFIKSLTHYAPAQKFVFLISFKKAKDWQEMLPQILPHAEFIIYSAFTSRTQDVINISAPFSEIEAFLKQHNYSNYALIDDQDAALVMFAEKLKSSNLVGAVTGSLYFLSALYSRLKSA